ncbi:hypothetical protein [Kitasatospora sp. MBT63]|uniref:hypothetical protein n=1 Tax=Kitasatospora sp. MBT63 TaxID=1444768 RepID=UPI0011EA66E0|nr:hypothetical protein [Kitasatospora sp. MBT63]
MNDDTRNARSDRDMIWPLPPMCGVLGVALTWHVPDPAGAVDAVCDVVRRQLVIWQIDRLCEDPTELLSGVLLHAVRHATGPLRLALALRSDGMALSVHQVQDSGWVTPAGLTEPGLRGAAERSATLTVESVPELCGYALVAWFPLADGVGTEEHLVAETPSVQRRRPDRLAGRTRRTVGSWHLRRPPDKPAERGAAGARRKPGIPREPLCRRPRHVSRRPTGTAHGSRASPAPAVAVPAEDDDCSSGCVDAAPTITPQGGRGRGVCGRGQKDQDSRASSWGWQ